MAEVAQEYSKPFAPRELECRDQIAVTGNGHNRLNRLGQREARNVEADAKVDALLANIRYEIPSFNCSTASK